MNQSEGIHLFFFVVKLELIFFSDLKMTHSTEIERTMTFFVIFIAVNINELKVTSAANPCQHVFFVVVVFFVLIFAAH